MANIFKQAQQVNEHPKRNNFDLSKKINASFKFGTLYPVYCQPVVPGDSFSIDTAFNIKAMPVVFPVQTKMRAHMHYFYVRNKNLWNNWENWISNLPNANQALTPHPFVSRPDSEFFSGSLHDFLGVPTSLVTNSDVTFLSPFVMSRNSVSPFFLHGSLSNGAKFFDIFNNESDGASLSVPAFVISHVPIDGKFSFSDLFSDLKTYLASALSLENIKFRFWHGTTLDLCSYDGVSRDFASVSSTDFSLLDRDLEVLKSYLHNGEKVIFTTNGIPVNDISPFLPFLPVTNSAYSLVSSFLPSGFADYSEIGADLYSNKLHINALPYRAYESIYNAYYRNNVVDPLTVNGEVLYNKFIPNNGDGADSYNYQLHQRNYELDFLTSALPSPQQGVAPMVGVTALGDITIEDENGITTARTESDEAGFVTKVVLTSPAASNDHARMLMNIAASGFNINDFRNTNALQRFLETSIRKGYKYKDFIAGHFGVEPKYVELDMPEFIGGFTRDVAVSTVISNADTLGDNSGAALGEYGGYAQVVGGSRHSVRHYCDDYGFIMGILCITPTPCYSQLLPKHMIAPDNFLDYYFAEFSNIGMQPITYKEVAPIQSYLDSFLDSNKSLEDTFGYQRPNYDMVAAVDEVHGDFRGSLRNYVINRIFDTRPELGHDFIAVRPEEVNDIFVDTDPRDDTFIGEIGFSVHAKRPVPRVVIPNLGR